MLADVLALVADPQVWLYVTLGLILGLVVGAIPGLTATTAVTVLLPIAFFLPSHVGIPFLIAVTKGAFYAGAIPAILISTPGTGGAEATVLDGYPLARQGKARKALEVSLYGSTIGDILSNIVALVLAGAVASVALRLGPPEMSVIMIAGLATIAMLSGSSKAKGMISAGLGLMIAGIGLDPTYGVSRMTFGFEQFAGGFDFIVVVLGLYAITELLIQGRSFTKTTAGRIRQLGEGLTKDEFVTCLPAIFRGTAVGILIGLVPALNQAVAAFLAWAQEKKRSKNPERFGKGALEGVATVETANNAVNGPAMVPLLTFGIPGDTITAVLLAALLVHGISPGPRIFEEHGEQVYALFLIFILSSVVLLIIGKLVMPWVARVADLPMGSLLAFGCVFSMVGAYAIGYSTRDVLLIIAFGLLGYAMTLSGIPREPLLITMLLAPPIEAAVSQSLAMGGPGIFTQRPIAIVLAVAFVVGLTYLSRTKKTVAAAEHELVARED
jgi:putative tricarboxylic transport membrane protein